MRALQRLHQSLKSLPGIGPKQAERLALFLLRSESRAEELLESLAAARKEIRLCPECWNLTDRPLCRLCSDSSRDRKLLCVVSEPQDAAAIERAGYRGLFHVLHGSLSPLDGVGPERLRLKELVSRVERLIGTLSEVILATNPDTEGETTALYVSGLLRPLGLPRISRIARGVPLGGDLNYMDEETLSWALSGRRDYATGAGDHGMGGGRPATIAPGS